MEISTILKNLSYIPVFFIAPTGLSLEGVAILVGLMMFDLLTGILKSATIYGWSEITSNLFISGFVKKLMLICMVMMLGWGGQALMVDLNYLIKGTFSVLVLYEMYSNIGNIYSARVGKEVREFDAVAFILGKIHHHMEGIMKSHTIKK